MKLDKIEPRKALRLNDNPVLNDLIHDVIAQIHESNNSEKEALTLKEAIVIYDKNEEVIEQLLRVKLPENACLKDYATGVVAGLNLRLQLPVAESPLHSAKNDAGTVPGTKYPPLRRTKDASNNYGLTQGKSQTDVCFAFELKLVALGITYPACVAGAVRLLDNRPNENYDSLYEEVARNPEIWKAASDKLPRLKKLFPGSSLSANLAFMVRHMDNREVKLRLDNDKVFQANLNKAFKAIKGTDVKIRSYAQRQACLSAWYTYTGVKVPD